MATAMSPFPSQSSTATVDNLAVYHTPSQSSRQGWSWTNEPELLKWEPLQSLCEAEPCTKPTSPQITPEYEQIWRLSTQLPYCKQMFEELRREQPHLVKEFWLPKQYQQRDGTVLEAPMSLLGVKTKLDEKKYLTGDEYGSDMRLVVTSCYKHCSAYSALIRGAHDLQHAFEVKFSRRPNESSQAVRFQILTQRMLCKTPVKADKTPVQAESTTHPLQGEGWDSRCHPQQRDISSNREELDDTSSEDTDSGADLSDSDRQRMETILVLKKRVRDLQAKLLAEIDQQIMRTLKTPRARRNHRKAEAVEAKPRYRQHVLKESRRKTTAEQNSAQKQTFVNNTSSRPDLGRNTPRAPTSFPPAHAQREGHGHRMHCKASQTFSRSPANVKQGTKPLGAGRSPQTSNKIPDAGKSRQTGQDKIADVWEIQQRSKQGRFEDEDSDVLTPVDISVPIKYSDFCHGAQVEDTTYGMKFGIVERAE